MVAIIGVVVAIFLVFIFMYNGLIARKNGVENAYASIDVQLKQRHDLIPNLVSTVRTYMEHERGTLEKLVELRVKATTPGLSANQSTELENQITKTLSGLMVSVENYPQLKASENMTQLQRSLNEVEAQLAAARRAFNSAATEFNNALEMFPTNLLAGMMGFHQRELFVAADTEKQNPNVAQLFKA